MSAAVTNQVGAEPPAPGAALSATDLAELMASFNEVTSKLERTHARLRAEVGRLRGELRDANEALQRSKRLAALGEMAAGIAHEIRNPLGSIRLYARMLEEDLAGLPEPKAVATKIARATHGLDAVVGDVLTFSRELRVRTTQVDSRALLERAVDECRAELGEHTDVMIESGDEEIVCDPLLVNQALVNLLRNAAEANRVGGGSMVRMRCELRTGGGAVLSVIDEGDGVPPEVVERMFNPFFTTREAGTGLGLPIVHRIADAHGGRAVVFNNADDGPAGSRGATVQLHLPARASESGEVVVCAPAAQAATKLLKESR